jgi:hypothetical protein
MTVTSHAEVIEQRVRERLAEAARRRELSDAKLDEVQDHRWRLLRNLRLLREARELSRTVDDMLAENTIGLATLRGGIR